MFHVSHFKLRDSGKWNCISHFKLGDSGKWITVSLNRLVHWKVGSQRPEVDDKVLCSLSYFRFVAHPWAQGSLSVCVKVEESWRLLRNLKWKWMGLFLKINCLFKMLGFTISSKLDWGSYIISIAKTASKKIGALICSMKFLSPEVALFLYKSTICPCME